MTPRKLVTALKLITGPAVEPVTLQQARDHLRIVAAGSPPTHPDDTRVQRLIAVARQHLDGRHGLLGRCLVPQTWELHLDRFPPHEIRIPLPPLIQVLSVKYDDENGAEQTVDAANYVVDPVSEPGWIAPAESANWPGTLETLFAVRVRFKAGYPGGSPEDGTGVPEPIRDALLLGVEALYDGNEKWPDAAFALLSPFEASWSI